jgi:hypothetical protein
MRELAMKCDVIQCKGICDQEEGLEDKRLNDISLTKYPTSNASVKLLQFEVTSSTASQYPYFTDLVFRKKISLN